MKWGAVKWGAVKWRERVQVGLLRLLVRGLRGLGPVGASDLAGWVARGVGPWLPASRVAERNLVLTMPGLDRAERRRVVRGAWDSLGRTVGELPHLGSLPRGRLPGPSWFVEGGELAEAMVASGRAGILFSGHIGNWELLPLVAAAYGMDFATFYRAADNRAADLVLGELRGQATARPTKFFAKGAGGAREALAHLKRGGCLAFMMDQKMNDGIKARLFGRAAMTAPAAATLALRLRCPVLPVHVERLGPSRFRVVVEESLPLPDTGDRAADVLALTQAMNDRLEAWVRARPASWLWMHRRFDKGLYRRSP